MMMMMMSHFEWQISYLFDIRMIQALQHDECDGKHVEKRRQAKYFTSILQIFTSINTCNNSNGSYEE